MYVCMYVCMYAPSFKKSLKFFGTSIAPSDTETVDLPAFSILSAMFTGACGPTEKLSLALAPCSNVLRMIVKLAYDADTAKHQNTYLFFGLKRVPGTRED